MRAACGTCPFWMRGYRSYGTGGTWKVRNEKGDLFAFGDCRARPARPEPTEDGPAWGRTHAEDWCATHPDFSHSTARDAFAEAGA